MWQKCPTCNGTGIPMTVSSSHSHCPTCRGMRIISELSGLPPFIVDVNSTQSVTNVTVLKGTDSKDDITSSQTEISDEEYYKDVFYQKQVMNPYPTGDQSYTAYEKGFMDFAKWYREQLKKKQ